MRRVAIGVFVLFFAVTAPASAGPAGSLSADPHADASVRLAIRRAHERLGLPECQLIYSDFSDSSGEKLDTRLVADGLTGAGHFQKLLFAVGDRKPTCRRGGILAFTSPGSSAVYVCVEAFADAARRDTDGAIAILIHEQLHTLGLGENPPTSAEITQSVLRRCGR